MKKFSRVLLFLLLIAVGLAIVPGAGAATFVVAIGNYFFRPTNLVINVSDSVLWTNQGSFPHDTTHGTTTTPAGSRLWASALLSQNQTFTFTFSNAGFYPYICKAHTVDDGGTQPQQTGTVSVITGNLRPTVNLTSPANAAKFTNAASLTISANAADTNGAVDHVDFFASGNLVGTDNSLPYSIVASNLPPGTNILTAVVTDNLGLTATSPPVSVVLTNVVTTNVINVGSFFFNPSLITISAGSSLVWSNGSGFSHTATGDTGLEPLCGAGFTLSSTARCTNRFMTPGVYTYFCSIHPTLMHGTVVVARAASTPIVTLTKPVAGSVFFTNGPIVFEATASDSNGIASVEFFHSGSTSLGSDAVAPYTVSNNLAAGSYSVFAKATDTLGFGALTPQVPISVTAPAELRLVSPQISNTSMQFDLTTTAGSTYVVEQSPLLPGVWQPFTTNVATGMVLRVTDPTPVTGQTQKVYRAYLKQ